MEMQDRKDGKEWGPCVCPYIIRNNSNYYYGAMPVPYCAVAVVLNLKPGLCGSISNVVLVRMVIS
jgi:hypothetical protein